MISMNSSVYLNLLFGKECNLSDFLIPRVTLIDVITSCYQSSESILLQVLFLPLIKFMKERTLLCVQVRNMRG